MTVIRHDRFEAKIIKADFAACSGYRVNFLRCEASLLKDRECPIFYGHGRKVDMVLLLLVGFLIRIVGRLNCEDCPIIYRYYSQVIEVDSVSSI